MRYRARSFLICANIFVVGVAHSQPSTAAPAAPSTLVPHPHSKRDFQSVSLPKIPTSPNKGLAVAAQEHNIPLFPHHLASYISFIERKRAQNPIHYEVNDLPFSRINVYHSFKLSREGINDDDLERDWVKASPLNGGRFDTVVVLADNSAEVVGLAGASVSQSQEDLF